MNLHEVSRCGPLKKTWTITGGILRRNGTDPVNILYIYNCVSINKNYIRNNQQNIYFK